MTVGGRWSLAARLLAAIVVVVLAGSATAWAVASAIGPAVFHVHIERSGTSDPAVVRHSEEAFATASAYSLALALAAALTTSVVVSVFLTRRIAHSLDRVRQAAAQVADGDYTVRVPDVGMGAEFDDLARSFNTMAADLGRIEQTRTRLLGDLAHEMRTPVATLDGYLEGIQDGVVPADEETLGMLRDQVSRLARLAQDISLVTTAEEGRLTMDRRPVRVGTLVDAAVAQAAARYAARTISLGVAAPQDAGATVVSADVDRMGQVLTNLLDNALRYTPRGGHVVVRVAEEGGAVRIQVADDGEGIAAEHLPHVFERFYRADTARDRAHGGSGIGLAVTRSIVRAHGGEVTAASPGKGQGATFTVELPAADAA
ncbi:sensor histidine kinase [Georgenia sp. SUBG003]|uniref:sensor histidine kinase n=1 Tax=Georgenia sp. SUBG003 TaxID=1497974 RepID=UPI0004D396E1|nr:histidine kinase [Georgenia sp. SUBG003]